MRIVLQRASHAQVTVDGAVVGALPAPGLVALVGIHRDDTVAIAEKLAAKVWGLRVLEGPVDETPESWSRGDVSASDINAPLLVVSQFTLYGDCRKGRRPSWEMAAKSEVARPIFDHFVATLRRLGAHVETGRFGAMMEVSLVNNGPVTLIVEG
ncbi:MAG: D-tyrosyl-tRNA(Tyr) deacylase [Propionibacteriaceae bacterium]|jgi:D-tyrosyl-tRNA(Tyr) deacylase|nr:D-tyrosyl-tRNA(Tyr) deacylase [Propionibacteriaceae bacterium]